MPRPASAVWLLMALLSFPSVAHSRDVNPTDDFCSLSAHMMAQKDGILYIAGGLMLYPSPDLGYNGPNTVLRSLNVSKGFQTSLDSVNYIRTEEIPSIVPGVSDAAFFPTESGFDLTFGVWWPYNSTIYGNRDPPSEDQKWQYEIATRQWTSTEITLRNWVQTNTSTRVSSSMTVWIPSLKAGFFFGGNFVATMGSSLEVVDLEEHNGLITYNYATNTWTNETTPLGGISEGGLVHITTATDEVLIQLGGRSEWATRLRKFSEINIYSVNQSKWYTQYLPPGAVAPTPRFAFCIALKSASDGSSHQIYIMGGLEASTLVDATGGLTTGTIWVLSIPSFEWAQLPYTSKTMAADPGGRISPKCQPIGEHYIFYYGGRNAPSYSSSITCDSKANAAFLFDVNTLTWTDEFTPSEGTYEIPSKVLALIGGDKTGGSPKRAPAKGWSHPDLETIMTLKDPPMPHGTNVGAIAGGTVGGVMGIALGLLSAMIVRRRHQRRISQLPPKPVELPSTCAGALEESGSPAELMENNQVDRGGVRASELPSGDVGREINSRHWN